ncbi:MAG: TrkH family potassium uptake protein [Lachnospiraceae bacterium]
MSKKGLPFLRIMQKRFHLSSFQVILLGFAGVIFLGALLLMLPVSSRAREVTPFLDALFTSTSATCVTGLVVYDTWTHWSLFGQVLILVLIQIGGLGVVTMAVALAVLSGRRVSLMQRSVMQDSISSGHVGGMVRLTRFIVRTSAAIEILGAAVLFPVFARDFGVWKGLWYAVFHSVSAFCNAGFDLNGSSGQFSSLTRYEGNPVVNITVMALITVGGIGFLVWEDLAKNRRHLSRCRLQTKVVLVTSLFLDLVPAVLFYFGEYRNLTGGTRVLASLFQSVTCRTAGFNTTDLSRFSESGILLMIFLMLIGGSPGSTAGGMKTTTAALLFASAISVFRRQDDTVMFRRRVDDDTVRQAAAILMMYLLLFGGSAMVISRVEHVPLLSAMFETGSAVGTVGLTLGLTPKLGALSHLILIVLMYFGRVGGLTIIYAAVRRAGHGGRYPRETLTVG